MHSIPRHLYSIPFPIPLQATVLQHRSPTVQPFVRRSLPVYTTFFFHTLPSSIHLTTAAQLSFIACQHLSSNPTQLEHYSPYLTFQSPLLQKSTIQVRACVIRMHAPTSTPILRSSQYRISFSYISPETRFTRMIRFREYSAASQPSPAQPPPVAATAHARARAARMPSAAASKHAGKIQRIYCNIRIE